MRPSLPSSWVALCLCVALIAGAPRRAAADAGDTAVSLGEALVYLVPTGGAAITAFVSGTHLALDEGLPYGWRLTGIVFGASDLVLSGVLFATRNDSTQDLIVATVPAVLGTAALVTSLLAPRPDDLVGHVAVVPARSGVTLTLTVPF